MEEHKSCYAKLSICNLGVAIGLVWGLGIFVLGLLSMAQIGNPIIHVFGSLYIGYKATFLGCVLGFVWGFLHGFVNGALIAFFYNWCRCCCPCKYCKEGRCCEKGKTCK